VAAEIKNIIPSDERLCYYIITACLFEGLMEDTADCINYKSRRKKRRTMLVPDRDGNHTRRYVRKTIIDKLSGQKRIRWLRKKRLKLVVDIFEDSNCSSSSGYRGALYLLSDIIFGVIFVVGWALLFLLVFLLF